MAYDYTPAGRIGRLMVRGRTLTRDVAEAVIDGELSLTTGEVTQLTITILDADERLLASRIFDLRGQADYGDLKLEVAAVGTGIESGVYTLEVAARSLGAQRMRRRRDKLVERDTSPTTFVRRRARAAGLDFLGQPSAKRKTIRRKASPDGPRESDWEAAQRLAGELGYIAFESAGRFYFGRPTWLLENTTAITLGPDTAGVLGRPTCRRASDNPKTVTVDLDVDDELGERIRPGMAIDLVDVATFEGTYLVDSVTLPLDDTATVTVAASTAVNPEKQPPPAPAPTPAGTVPAGIVPAGVAGASSLDGRAGGGPTANAFTSYALAQAGDRYIFGAEANLSDADPDVFDCSELVEWAAKRAGVTFVDGSGNQLARCQAKGTVITVAQAIRTRGALLFGSPPGISYITHVGISLGNGRTIEAVNRSYGVREMSATGRVSIRWVAAGLVPGLQYGGAVQGPLL